MPRNKRHLEHENHERWLVSYADFITLLFAFFVVMFASSQTDRNKQQQMSDAMKKAMEENRFSAAMHGILGGVADNTGKGNAMMRGPGGSKADAAELARALEHLKKQLHSEIEAGTMEVRMTGRGIVITLAQTAFFPSGDDTVAAGSYASVGKVAQTMTRLPNPIRLEGHTDSRPIRNSRFQSNWELSAARAISMMHVLANEFGVPESRMAIGGYSDTVPIAANESEEGRSRNRRVDIVILSANGMLDQPAGSKSK